MRWEHPAGRLGDPLEPRRAPVERTEFPLRGKLRRILKQPYLFNYLRRMAHPLRRDARAARSAEIRRSASDIHGRRAALPRRRPALTATAICASKRSSLASRSTEAREQSFGGSLWTVQRSEEHT